MRGNGAGDLKATLQYSTASFPDQSAGHFVSKVSEDVRLGHAFISPRAMVWHILGLRVSPVGVVVSVTKVVVSATKVRIIHGLNIAFLTPGVKGDTNFETTLKCKLSHVLGGHSLEDIVLTPRAFTPHPLRVKQDGC